jgi:serine protease AprX
MRMKLIALLAFAGLFVTALSADVSTTLPSENVRAHSGKILGNLSDLMAKTTQPIPVIVVLNAPATTGVVNRLQGLAGGFPVRYVYDVIPGFAAELTSRQIAALARDATVHQVEYDAEVHADIRLAQMGFGTDTARTDFDVDGDMDGDATRYTKDDVVITILDTGIDSLHMDLDGGKVIAWKDFVNNKPAPYDDNGHGTHCASIAAGTGDGSYHEKDNKGVAPGAALVGVKVLNSAGYGTWSNVIAGIDWVVANKATYGIRVLSISLGSSGNSDGKDAQSLACNSAVDAGIVVCVSAGNDGPAKNTIGSPAAAAKPITVGAMCAPGHGGYYLADFSSRGPTKDKRVKPDICGPGVYIMAAKAGTRNEYTMKSGTSMAAPFVAGTAALMLDAKPALTPADIKSDLMSTAQDWGPSGADIDYGAGREQGYDAVKLAFWQAGHDTTGYDGPVFPPHVYEYDALGGKGKTDIWQVNYDTTASYYHTIAVTMIMPNWKSGTSPNFDLRLYDPSGKLVASGATQTREDYFSYGASHTLGNYQIHVTSVAGSGDYFFDLCCPNCTSITRIQNQFGPQGTPVPLAGSVIPRVTEPAAFRNGGVRLGFELAQPGAVRLAVYDGAGRTVAVSTANARSGRNEMTVGLPQVSGGVYFYRLESGSASAVGKFAVIR